MYHINQTIISSVQNRAKEVAFSAITVLTSLSILFFAYTAMAQTDTLTATVTATSLSVSVSDGTIAFGSVALNTATSTAGTAQTQTVSNDGSNAVLNVKSSDATNGTTWTLGTNPGSDIFKLEVSTTSGATYGVLTATDVYLTASSSFASLGSQPTDFRFTTPTVSTDFVQKSLTITVQVTTP